MKKMYSKLIDDYLMGSLAAKEQKEFEDMLTKNPALQARIKLCSELKDSIVEQDIHTLREKLDTSHKQSSKPLGKIITLKLFLSAAACILLVIFIRSIFFGMSPDHEKIFQDHFHPYQVVGETRNNEQGSVNNLGNDAVRLYANKQYFDVIPLLESHIVLSPSDFQAVLMLATALIETGNAEKAEELLSKQLADSISMMYEEAIHWYHALSVLRQGKTDKAKDLFQCIADEDGFYAKDARSILDTL